MIYNKVRKRNDETKERTMITTEQSPRFDASACYHQTIEQAAVAAAVALAWHALALKQNEWLV